MYMNLTAWVDLYSYRAVDRLLVPAVLDTPQNDARDHYKAHSYPVFVAEDS